MNECMNHSCMHACMHARMHRISCTSNAFGRRISSRDARAVSPDAMRSMDFQGQRASERAAKVTLAIGAVVAYARGWLAGGDFGETMRAFAWSVAVACVVSVPPWNVYARNPVTWRSSTRVGGEAREEEGKSGDGKKTQKKKKERASGRASGTPARTRRAAT